MKKVAFAIPIKNEWGIRNLVDEIFALDLGDGVAAEVVLAVDNNSTPEYREKLSSLIEGCAGKLRVLELGDLAGRPFSYSYLMALREAAQDSDIVVEIDASWSFPPKYAGEMVRFLIAHPEYGAVFSNRFFHSGRIANIYQYSWRRILISAVGTLLSNPFLGLGGIYPDMTSGLSVVKSGVVKSLFQLHPDIDSWVSVKFGPGHFFQTDYRAQICWLGTKIYNYPIVMGALKDRKPYELPRSTVLGAFKALLELRKVKKDFVIR